MLRRNYQGTGTKLFGVTVLMVACVAGLGSPAVAQDGRGEGPRGGFGGGGGFFGRGLDFTNLLQPHFAHRDLAILDQTLDLHHGQRAILQVLLEDYLESYEQEAEELRQVMSQVEQSRQEAREQMREQMREQLREQMRELRQQESSEAEEVRVIPFGDRDARIVIEEGVGIAIERREDSGEMARTGWREMSADQREGIRVVLREQFEDMDEESREQLRQRMRERREQARAARERVRQLREEARERGDDDAIRPDELERAARHLLRAKDTLNEQFVGDIQLILNDEQIAHWDEAERHRYRVRALPRGQGPSELINVKQLLAGLSLPSLPPHETARVLETYELELDRTLRERDRYIQQAEIARALAMLDRDMEQHMRTLMQERHRRAAVARTHQNAIEQLIALCADANDAEALRQAMREQMHPHVYQQTQVDRAYGHALELEGLSEETRQSIVTHYEIYQQKITPLNRRTADALDQLREASEQRMQEMIEQMEAGEDMRRMRRPIDGNEEFVNYRQIRDERRAVIQQYTDLLAGVLGDRFEELPESVRQPQRADRRARREFRDRRQR